MTFRPARLPLALIASTGLVTACASLPGLPDRADPTLAANTGLGEETARLSLPDAFVYASEVDAATVESWAQLTGDPVLTALIAEGLENSPGLRASAATVARAEGFLQQARSGLAPSLGFSLGTGARTPLEDVDVTDTASANLTARWEADLWGRIDTEIRAADLNLMSSRAFYEASRQALAAAIARTYVSAIEAGSQVAITEATESALQETLRIVKVRYDEGFSPRRELVLAEADLAAARDDVTAQMANARALRRALETLIGRYPSDQIELPNTLPAGFAIADPGQPADVLRQRPDVLAAEFAVRTAFADLAVVEAGRWPSLSITGALSGNGTLQDLIDPAALFLSVGATLANSLFDGGLTQGRLTVADANARQALADYGATALEAVSEVEARLDDIATLTRRSQLVAQGAAASRETLRLAEIQYREGDFDLLDVLTFRQRALNADRTVLLLKRQALEARIALYLALGGGAVE